MQLPKPKRILTQEKVEGVVVRRVRRNNLLGRRNSICKGPVAEMNIAYLRLQRKALAGV